MESEMAVKLSTDGSFLLFCRVVDSLKEDGGRISLPWETAVLLLGVGVDFVKGEDFDKIHKMVMEFLGNKPWEGTFHDYFLSEVIGR